MEISEVTRNKLIKRLQGNKMGISAQIYLSAARSHKLLWHPHWGHSIRAEGIFNHTPGFWSNNNNKFCARTVKEFLGNIPTQPSAPSLILLLCSSVPWQRGSSHQRCRLITRKNRSDSQLLQDCSSPKTSAASTYQQRENEGIVHKPWKALCHHWAFAE